MKIIKLKCKCGKEFDRELREYRRQIKNGNNTFYCTLSCSGRYGKGITFFSNHIEVPEHLRSFRIYLTKSKKRNKKYSIDGDITLEYLKEIFDSQNGKCIYTGVNLIHQKQRNRKHKEKDYIYMASLDRIDSDKGYKVGNVQFISVCMNYAKNNMSHEKAKEFIAVIRNVGQV